MKNLKDVKHDDLIKMFNISKEYQEYIDVEKKKLDEIEKEKKTKKENKETK